ncbi:MAG: non-histone chromosomal MC1 family protein [Methanotrichaceae archaeon]
MAEKAARNFALRDAKGKEDGVFTGKSPRQAALKAANRGVKDIRLRERGTKKVHIFITQWSRHILHGMAHNIHEFVTLGTPIRYPFGRLIAG